MYEDTAAHPRNYLPKRTNYGCDCLIVDVPRRLDASKQHEHANKVVSSYACYLKVQALE
jgi:hypothetical protein